MFIWKCCGKNYSSGVTKCPGCGRPQSKYGVLDEVQERNQRKKKKPTPEAKPEQRRPVEELDSDEKFFTSNIKFRDGRPPKGYGDEYAEN